MVVFEYRMHLKFSILSFLVFSIYIHDIIDSLAFLIFCLLGTILGTLLPDIDHNNSKINKELVITKVASKFSKHRSFFHSIFALILFYILFVYIENLLKLYGLSEGVFIGYITHILTDMATPRGVKLLWPLNLSLRYPIVSNTKNSGKIFCYIIYTLLFLKCLNLI